MPPFQPVLSISRSQSVRLGRGPGLTQVQEIDSGDLPYNVQSGQLIGPFYADLGNPLVRRDYQHHQALGALVDFTAPNPMTTYSDLFLVSGGAVTAGTGYAVNVSAGVIQSRFSGAQLNFPAAVLTPATPPAFGNRQDLVAVSNSGQVSLYTGPADTIAVGYQTISLIPSAALTAGTFKLGFSFNGYWFTTAAIAYNATAATIATAVLAATGGPNNVALSAFCPGAGLTGSGGPLSSNLTVSLVASGSLETNASNVSVLTAGTITGGTITTSSVEAPGGGQAGLTPTGGMLVLAPVNVPSTATSSANYTIGAGWALTS